MDKSIQRLKVRRAFISLSVAALMASIAAVLGFVFAVQPVWSTSAQMQAEREANTSNSIAPAAPSQTLASVTWEEAVAGYMASYDDEPILHELAAFEGVEAKEFFKLRQGALMAPTEPNDVVGSVKLYFIPGHDLFFFRLENFDVPGGPGYRIALSKARAPRHAKDIRANGYRFLASMDRFQGSRNIAINPDTVTSSDDRPTLYRSLVIWNAEYDVVIATATLN